MFLIDKYQNDPYFCLYYQDIVNKIIESFDSHKVIYANIADIIKLPFNKLKDIIYNLENEIYRYINFQHLIIYGNSGTSKEYIVTKLLEQIYGKHNVEIKDVEYTISGYSNTKTKIIIKQSKYHIIIEPNFNGFDKYLIQEIIYEYAKSELLNILKYKKLFKVVVINKIDNLSYYAQASLRRTMEKFSDTCKFILICDQLAKVIEPLRSRCLLIRIPLPTDTQIYEALLYINHRENINISYVNLYNIIKKVDNIMNNTIWLLEMYKYNVPYKNNWILIIDNIVEILQKKILSGKDLYNTMKKIREKFYLLFITNISTQLIMRKIMIKLLEKIDDIYIKYNIIQITSIFEQRLNQGTRQIIQFEAYILNLIQLFINIKKYTNIPINYNFNAIDF